MRRERDDEMEVYPILHREKIYNIITAFDMTFKEVRNLLDWLDAHQAFEVTEEREFMGPGVLFSPVIDGTAYEVDVYGYEVVVYRRTPR